MAARDFIGGDKERQAERLAVDEAARIRPNDWSSLEVRIINFSSSGFRAACDARLRPGSCVSIDVPGIGPVEAMVEWQREAEFGARFVQPIVTQDCGWAEEAFSAPLADLLIERAAASRSGRREAEHMLRRRILNALPMQRIEASSAKKPRRGAAR